jgi:branched-chain amino acid transport system ATP-binding protein
VRAGRLHSQTILQVSDVHTYYGNIHALKGLSLTVGRGEVVTLIGNNGAGKTSMLNTISGLLKPKKGEITFEGERIDSISPHRIVRLGISQVPEGRKIFTRLSVTENLEMGAFTRKNGAHINRDMRAVFELFPRLEERRTQIAGTLSGGEQQMLAIGRALMARPRLLILDEPSMGLAPLLVESIFDTIVNINADGTTILLVEQNAMAALSIANYGYVLETGKIVLEGDGAALLDDPEVRKAYLGE